VIADDYCRAIAGYFLYLEAPTALQTALALRQAIWRKEEQRGVGVGSATGRAASRPHPQAHS
jgi:hypothetical protein